MSLLTLPLKFVGLATVGAALAVGWKLGSYLCDVATNEETRDRLFATCGCTGREEGQPLWKRRYTKVSEG
jgi:hypothetical protein